MFGKPVGDAASTQTEYFSLFISEFVNKSKLATLMCNWPYIIYNIKLSRIFVSFCIFSKFFFLFQLEVSGQNYISGYHLAPTTSDISIFFKVPHGKWNMLEQSVLQICYW